MVDIPSGKILVLFDGYCNLCNGAVQFILKRDKAGRFLFSSLDWPVGREVVNRFPDAKGLDSILVLRDGKLYDRSSAALVLVKYLGALWPLFGLFWIDH